MIFQFLSSITSFSSQNCYLFKKNPPRKKALVVSHFSPFQPFKILFPIFQVSQANFAQGPVTGPKYVLALALIRVFRYWSTALMNLSVSRLPPCPVLSLSNFLPTFTANSALQLEWGFCTHCMQPILLLQFNLKDPKGLKIFPKNKVKNNLFMCVCQLKIAIFIVFFTCHKSQRPKFNCYHPEVTSTDKKKVGRQH